MCDTAGVESAVFMGASVGSFAALRVALDDPERVSRLVLVGGTRRAASGSARIGTSRTDRVSRRAYSSVTGSRFQRYPACRSDR